MINFVINNLELKYVREARLSGGEEVVEGLTTEQREQTRGESQGGKAAIEQGRERNSGKGMDQRE